MSRLRRYREEVRVSLELDEEDLETLGFQTHWDALAIRAEKLRAEKNARRRILRPDDEPLKRTARIRKEIQCETCKKIVVAKRPSRKRHCSDKCRLKGLYKARIEKGLTVRGTPRAVRPPSKTLAERWRTDPAFRARRSAAHSKYAKKRYANDPAYREARKKHSKKQRAS